MATSVEGHGAPPRGLRRHRRVERHGRPPSFRRLLEQGPRRRAHGHHGRLRAVATASTAGADDGHALGRARDGAAAARRAILACAHVRVFEIPSLSSSRGVLSREWLWPRASTAPLIATDWAVICKRGASCCGTLVHHLRKSQFPGGSRAFGRVGACARFLGVRCASGPAGGRGVSAASRARARRGGGEDWLTHVVWQRQRAVADAGSDGAGRAAADSIDAQKLPVSVPLHARSVVKRGPPIACLNFGSCRPAHRWTATGRRREDTAHSDGAARESNAARESKGQQPCPPGREHDMRGAAYNGSSPSIRKQARQNVYQY